MTAAHCMGEAKNNAWSAYGNLTIRARNDTTQADQAPFAAQTLTFVWVPSEYYNGTCTTVANCNKFDIAFAVVSDTFPSGHPGWFGWDSNLSNAQMDAMSTRMDGYPGCNSVLPARPQTNCTEGTVYGDDNTDCNVGGGTNFSNDSSGQSRELTFKCDGSPGMSGGPIFAINAFGCSGTGFCVLGQYNQYTCEGPACSGVQYPNAMGRMTGAYASIVAYLISTNP
jgi:hypothetical protein